MIHRQAEKMSLLISQLLSMTRLEQGTERTNFGPVDIGTLVRELCAEQKYDSRCLTLELSEGITVWGDPGLLSRLVQNLVDNAFKYGSADGHVWVSAFRKNGEVLLQVRDNGIGIHSGEQEKIWHRFYQVDPARSGDSGAGLGLAMVKQIAQLHGGSVRLESAEGAGSTFTLHLPENHGE